MERSRLADGGVALGAIAAFLYAASAAYDGGYFAALHLDADVLDRNLQQVLFDGFLRLVISTNTLVVLLAYVTVRMLYAYVLFPALIDYVRHGWSRKRKLVQLKRRLGLAARKDTRREREKKRRAGQVALLGLGFIGIFLVLAHIEGEGRNKAISLLGRIEANAVADGEMINVIIGAHPQRLVYLTCGARNCAGLDRVTRTVHYFPQTGHSYVLPVSQGKVAPKK